MSRICRLFVPHPAGYYSSGPQTTPDTFAYKFCHAPSCYYLSHFTPLFHSCKLCLSEKQKQKSYMGKLKYITKLFDTFCTEDLHSLLFVVVVGILCKHSTCADRNCTPMARDFHTHGFPDWKERTWSTANRKVLSSRCVVLPP